MEDIILKVNEREFPVHYDSTEHKRVIIDGKPFEVELIKKFDDDVYTFSVNNKLCQVSLDYGKDGKIDIDMNGFSYEIEVTNSTRKLLERYLKESGKAGSQGVGLVKAPMPGLIVKIFVEPGMTVQPGDKLIIVEAMKMENVLKATVGGVVKSINVKESVAVDKDAVLMEIDTGSNG